MCFERSNRAAWGVLDIHAILVLFVMTTAFVCLNGCFEKVKLSAPSELSEFERAGPVYPAMDLDQLVGAGSRSGLYRVVSGDVLELTMPTILQVVMAKDLEAVENVSKYMCRVSDNGTVTLPIVGEIRVAGKALGQTESIIIDAYYPKYIGIRPSVLAQVAEYNTAKVSITGAVKNPGIYELRSDRMSLVAVIMESGGIVDDGAARIWIMHADQAQPDQGSLGKDTGRREHQSSLDAALDEAPSEQSLATAEPNKPQKSEPVLLPVKGLNIPFADVALRDGDAVVVERLEMPIFTVIGLVNKPGNYPYPPDVQYNLVQAIAYAEGLEQDAKPRYATIYRLKADGTIVRTPFRIINPANGSEQMDSLNVMLKPGDIVAVEHTPRIRRNLFLQKMFNVNVGAYVPIPIMR